MAGERISAILSELEQLCQSNELTYGGIVDRLAGRNHAVFVILAAVPFVVPIPLPGLSIPFGIFIMIAGTRILLGRGPWVPKRWVTRKVPGKQLMRVLRGAGLIFAKIERFSRPRGMIDISPRGFRAVGALVIIFAGFLLALPLPPGTNLLPGWSVLLTAVGLVDRDEVLFVAGLLLTFLTGALYIGIPVLGLGVGA